jgi:hypothetical protein
VAAVFSKRYVKVAPSLQTVMTTTSAGSVGIDNLLTDWLRDALRQADFLLWALIDIALCEWSVMLSLYGSIHCDPYLQ